MTILLDATKGTTTPGLYSSTTFTGTYSDGIVVDYTSTLGRISVGGADGLAFYNGGVAATELGRFDTSGNFGIGTSSPTGRLSIAVPAATSNTIRMTGSTTASVFAQFQNTGGSMYVGKDDSAGASFGGAAYAATLYSSGAYPMAFWTNDSERMRIDSSGNLLVGATSTSVGEKMKVSGNTNVFVTRCSNSSNAIVTSNASGTASYSAAVFCNNGDTYSGCGTISVSGTSTAYNTTSDYRLKENVKPMINALDKVAQLNPVTYSWKFDGSDGQGFIAHELQAVVPDCVTGEKDAVDADGKPVYQGIDTSFLVATLCKAIQELKAEIDQLKGAK